MSGVAKTVSNFRSDVMGINDQANNAQNAAMAELSAKQRVTAEARQQQGDLISAAQSPQQLAALEKSLNAAQKETEFDLRQLNAIDPAIMEASKQVLGLLQGKTADANNPLMAQRQQMRQQLVNSLRAQYGPGAESTSIGQKALQQFDLQSNTMFQQNQQSTLGNLFGIATTQPGVHGITDLNNIASQYGSYQDRVLGATQAGNANVLSSLANEAGSAAAPFTADALKSGAQRQFFENMENDGRQIGRSWATFGMSNKGGGGGAGNSSGDPSGMGAVDTNWSGGGSMAQRGNGIGGRAGNGGM